MKGILGLVLSIGIAHPSHGRGPLQKAVPAARVTSVQGWVETWHTYLRGSDQRYNSTRRRSATSFGSKVEAENVSGSVSQQLEIIPTMDHTAKIRIRSRANWKVQGKATGARGYALPYGRIRIRGQFASHGAFVLRLKGEWVRQGRDARVWIQWICDFVERGQFEADKPPPLRFEIPVEPGHHELSIEVLTAAWYYGDAPADSNALLHATLTVEAVLGEKYKGRIPRPEWKDRCKRRPVRFTTPDPDPEKVHVTHVWPHWQWPSVYEGERPVFLARVDQEVSPAEVLKRIHVAAGYVGWRKFQWNIRTCVVEKGRDRTYTTVIFEPARNLLPDSSYDWLFSRVESPPYLPLAHGTTTTNRQPGGVFRTATPVHPVGTVDKTISIARALGAKRKPEWLYAALQNAEESFVMLREWGGIEISEDAIRDLKDKKEELFNLTGVRDAPLPLVK